MKGVKEVTGKDGGVVVCSHFYVQAEDGIRDAQESRELGDVYKRQTLIMQYRLNKTGPVGVDNKV